LQKVPLDLQFREEQFLVSKNNIACAASTYRGTKEVGPWW